MEANNVKAMREALRKIMGLFRDIDLTIDCPENEAYAIAAKALSAPPRNCDVGTPKEQDERFKAFCASYWHPNNVDAECAGCPINEMAGAECEFAWAQMPYEEGG